MTDMKKGFHELMAGLSSVPGCSVRHRPETDEWSLSFDATEVNVAYREATGQVLTFADVAPFVPGADDEGRARALLEMNWQWRGTGGFTVSVDGETGRLTLADRRRADRFVSSEAMGAYLRSAAGLVRNLRMALEDFEAEAEVAAGTQTGKEA